MDDLLWQDPRAPRANPTILAMIVAWGITRASCHRRAQLDRDANPENLALGILRTVVVLSTQRRQAGVAGNREEPSDFTESGGETLRT